MKLGEFLRNAWKGNEPEEFRPATPDELDAIGKHRPVHATGEPMVKVAAREPAEIDLGRVGIAAEPIELYVTK